MGMGEVGVSRGNVVAAIEETIFSNGVDFFVVVGTKVVCVDVLGTKVMCVDVLGTKVVCIDVVRLHCKHFVEDESLLKQLFSFRSLQEEQSLESLSCVDSLDVDVRSLLP
jgi:hypothetical protein